MPNRMLNYIISEKNILSEKIAKYLNGKLIIPEVRIFPDGEQKILLPKIKNNSKIIVIINSYPKLDSNIIRSFLLISKLKEISQKITLIIPYMPYARQDKEFLPGEIITSKIIANLYNKLNIERILVVDIHSNLVLKFFKNIHNISAVKTLGDYCSKMKLNHPIVVSPDLFWKKHAESLADCLDSESFALNKFRDRRTGLLKILPSKVLPIKGRDVIIFDDMISTGQSMILAAKFCKKNKCGKIVAVCTHGLLVNDAEKNMRNAGISKIICTNTIYQRKDSVDISRIIIENLG